MHSILQFISRFGYFGIFFLLLLGIVGLPIPDETVLTFAGYLVFKGHLRMLPTLLAACLGSLSGMTVSYLLGRASGLYLIQRYGRYVHITQEKIERARAWHRRVGKWGLTFGYFLPGIRHVTAYFAGASELEWRVFAVFAYSGGILWSFGFVWLGYHLGEKWETLGQELRTPLTLLSALLAAAGLVYYIACHWRARDSSGD